jgi:hypothetical protein
VNADPGQRVPNLVKLERLDNSHHDLHLLFPVFSRSRKKFASEAGMPNGQAVWLRRRNKERAKIG